MASRSVRIDDEVLRKLNSKADGYETPNQSLRRLLKLPEKKHNRKIPLDNTAKIKRHLTKAIELLEVKDAKSR